MALRLPICKNGMRDLTSPLLIKREGGTLFPPPFVQQIFFICNKVGWALRLPICVNKFFINNKMGSHFGPPICINKFFINNKIGLAHCSPPPFVQQIFYL